MESSRSEEGHQGKYSGGAIKFERMLQGEGAYASANQYERVKATPNAAYTPI
jgi:hypothetical protein